MSSPSQLAQDVAGRRTKASHTSMFLRMLMRAAVLRRGRAASALLAMVVAAAVATAMLNLYVDVQAKLRKEFRNYGANVVVVAVDGQSLPVNAFETVQSTLAGRGLAVPFAYVVAAFNFNMFFFHAISKPPTRNEPHPNVSELGCAQKNKGRGPG